MTSIAFPNANFAEARRFLELLDDEADYFHFQTFDDSPVKRKELARSMAGTLDALWSELMDLQKAGAGVFVAVNAIKPQRPRRSEHVTDIRAVFADFDTAAWQGMQYPLESLIEVESSPERRHVYWLVRDLAVEQFRPVQKAIAAVLGSDPTVIDPARVLRLPGTLHLKGPERPHLVRIVHAEPAQPYSAAQVLEAFPLPAPETVAPLAPPGGTTGRASEAHLTQTRRIAFDAARRTHDDPCASRHAELPKMAHFLRRDRIPLTKPVEEMVLETFEAHMRPTDTTGKPAPMNRINAAKALRETYNRPSEPDRPHHVGQRGGQLRHQAPPPAVSPGDPWPDPGEVAPAPGVTSYPIEVFPAVAREAVLEYCAYGKQPLPMLADACLAQMALATQGLADVGRDERLVSPLSLNVLIVGESGERKTGADAAFTQAAKAWEQEERERRAPEFHKAKAMQRTNQARKQALEKEIGRLEAKNSGEAIKEREAAEQRLIELEQREEELFVPPLPRLFYEDVTLEALAYEITTGWPSAALVSDEAGLVVGSRGMSDESALGFLTLLNRLWDGRSFLPLRKQAKSAEIRGRRFSSSLMIQQALLEKIADKGGRGVGFYGRYLLTAPRSTMGTRFYSQPPARMPALSAFNARMRHLLDEELPIVNTLYELQPPVLMADAGAQAAWIAYHDAVERELGDFGEFATVKDVAAKSAENAARIAGVFQVFDQGTGGHLKLQYMDAGIAIAAWHLQEANRIFFEADKPQEMQDAELLSTWLREVAPNLTRQDGSPLVQEGRIPKWEIGRVGPNQLRKDKDRRNNALLELAADGVHHVREARDGKKSLLEINPKLLNGKAS
jgi:hypothetical protein